MLRQAQSPAQPRIASKKVSILAFDADPHGKERADAALAKAIASLGEAGGTVVFPAGDFLLGPIHFSDGLEIHLEKDAVIRFSPVLEDYLPPVLGVYEGIRCYRPSAMLHAEGRHDIAITGEGLLDGQGTAWWDMVNYRAGTRHMLASAEAMEPPEARVYTKWEEGIRPCFLEFVDCERVLIQGVTFKDSPMWTVHPTWCRDVTVSGITIDNPMADRFHHSPNTDGVNLDGCDTALVENCTIYCGDDCVCMKSGKNADGRAAGHVCQNVEVKNCTFLRGIGGITIGSEMSGGCRNLYCHDIFMKDVTLGIWSKTSPERGGFIENLEYENITVDSAAGAGFMIMMNYTSDGVNPDFLPTVHHITAEHIRINDGKAGIVIEGMEGHEPYDICLRDVELFAETPVKITNAKNVTLEDISFIQNPEYIYRM